MRSFPPPAAIVMSAGAGSHWKPWNFLLISGHGGSSEFDVSATATNTPTLFTAKLTSSALPETSVSVSPVGSIVACSFAPPARRRPGQAARPSTKRFMERH